MIVEDLTLVELKSARQLALTRLDRCVGCLAVIRNRLACLLVLPSGAWRSSEGQDISKPSMRKRTNPVFPAE